MKEDKTSEDAYEALAGNLENLLKAAAPRLAYLARCQGVPPDVVGDVVQETLVAAWQNLAHLRSPEHFESWLNGICRNMSKRWARAQSTADLHQSTFSSLQSEPEHLSELSLFDMADPQSFDLTEELNRQDLAVLLDRAMNYLPASGRKALEMHYLADLPQREVALQLGMTINALEVKLHRARRQLRQVLQHELRADAESFGLLNHDLLNHDEIETQGWRDTSIWCCICGQQRLQGLFETQPGGVVALRMRCPTCSFISRNDLINTANRVSFANLRSFRPAFKQVLQILPSTNLGALTTGSQPCNICGQLTLLFGIEPEELPAPFYTRLSLVTACPTCGRSATSVFSLCLAYPSATQFVLQHKRCILEPEELIDYHEQPAIRGRISDLESSRRLTLILHRQTYQLLDVVQD